MFSENELERLICLKHNTIASSKLQMIKLLGRVTSYVRCAETPALWGVLQCAPDSLARLGTTG